MSNNEKTPPSCDTFAAANDTGEPRGLSVGEIRRHVGERAFARAASYTAWGAVFDTRRHGARLVARCEGSGQDTWAVEATLDEKTIAQAKCSCPVGAGGDCKHVGALLLTFRGDPERFVDCPTLEQRLDALDLEPCRDLLRAIITAVPEVEAFIDARLGPSTESLRPLPTGAWKLRAAQIFRDPQRNALQALGALLREGEGITQDNPSERAALYEQLAVAILGRLQKPGMSDPQWHSMADYCISGLRAIAAELPEGNAVRWRALRALMAMYGFEIDRGAALRPGVGGATVNAVVTVATPTERQVLYARAREKSLQFEGWVSRCWSVAALMLQVLSNDDSAWLAEARSLGQHGIVVRRLIATGRIDEALSALRDVADAELVSVARALESAGRGDDAERVVRARMSVAGAMYRAVMTQWVDERARAQTDIQESIMALMAVLGTQPERAVWKAIEARARDAGCWPEVRGRALGVLAERAPGLMVEVLLAEGDFDGAIERVCDERARCLGFVGARVTLADALEKVGKASDAARVLEKNAEALVVGRARENYRAAVVTLAKAVRLRDGAGEGEIAQSVIAAFRGAHARRPALRRELDRYFGPMREAG